MLLKVYPENPNPRHIHTVVECLMDGGIIIYPTDTVYGLGCDIFKSKAVERIALIKGIKAEKSNFSFICDDLSQLSDYSKPIPNEVFKLMRKNLPGPFTFILNASNNVPKLIQSKKKTVGIRIPDNNIPRVIVKELGHPIMSTSIHDDDEIIEYTTDPELIYEKYSNLVDIVIDGGYGDNEPSTVIDCTGPEPLIIREGKGILI
ncbi:MAG: threonylcarbamoyl-AMP synthase [Lentimicrobium sp.]|jgi:tRNA threonylcarbamoyl adenosine modification protein (Sua5/YciO/YrdC/YwlC family)|nr:threonylcarbamoyl-AMP synthase [Lentimicrobium sp.]MDD2529262.1 L-threonylcarbamoyladenylate synthase [Lentimicrobiaceae bacterium]MDD4598577.1 L-threonylcarbamoyladenylate synthase [Lentimicrobiaceae bacterium]MDY0024769.1 L-threonylcarbamoyladenylate synthase [Lentimicrobium sp.]